MSTIKVLGKGNVGEKARQLISKEKELVDIGFSLPPRYVIAQDTLELMLQRNRLGDTFGDVGYDVGLDERIMKGAIPRQLLFSLDDAIGPLKPSPLVIRSSAEGDARGTGIYTSVFSNNTMLQVLGRFQEALASYFSKDAFAFRKAGDLNDGFALIVEPVIGTKLKLGYGPIFSGHGYTSTSRGEGFINVVPYMGCAVDHRYGERIDGKLIKDFGKDMDVRAYLDLKSEDDLDVAFGLRRSKERTWLRDGEHPLHFEDEYFGWGFHGQSFFEDRGAMENMHVLMTKEEEDAFFHIPLTKIFNMMEQMEEKFQKPQYFEFAVAKEHGKYNYWIIQISDVEKKLDMIEFGDHSDILLTGDYVTGSGVKLCDHLVHVWNPDEVDALYQYNKDNKDYILLYTSRLTAAAGRGQMRKMGFSDYNNATVFIENQDAPHLNKNPISHLSGSLDTTGKFFSILDFEVQPPDWDALEDCETQYSTESGSKVRIHEGPFKVISSERQNKLIVVKYEK